MFIDICIVFLLNVFYITQINGLNFTLAGKCSCPMKIEPVCGSVASTPYTFMNKCVLECSKRNKPDVLFLYEGVCCRLSRKCDSSTASPVCDKAGKMYSNRCLFDYAQCVQFRQNKLQLKIDMANPNCKCVKECNTNNEPVCDTQGITHVNICNFMNAKCISQMTQRQQIEIDYMGSCCRNICTADLESSIPMCDTENKTHSNLCSFLKYRCERSKQFRKNPRVGFKSFGLCRPPQQFFISISNNEV